MRKTQSISRDDADAVLRLVNELHELEQGTARHSHLLTQVCQLLDAKISVLSLMRDLHPNRAFVCVSYADHGWPSAKERDVVMAYCDRPIDELEHVRDPMEAMMSRPGGVVTCRRRELMEDADWYRTGNVVELRRPGRIDDCVYSLHRLPVKSWVAGLGVHRDWGDRAQFTRRDREVLDLLNTHLSWMWTSDANHNLPQADGLSPRLRQTLRLLLTGRSEKEIAGAMGLNRGTVHKYVTALYRHFDVGSRAQLLARCLGSSAASQAERPKAG